MSYRSGGGGHNGAEISFEPHLFYKLLDAAKKFKFILEKNRGVAVPRRGADHHGFEAALKAVRTAERETCAKFDEEGRTLIGDFARPSAVHGTVQIKDYHPKLIGSYSWRETVKSQISIPGKFRRFKAPNNNVGGFRLNSDQHEYVDRANLNASLHSAELQLEPLFVALLNPAREADETKFNLNDYDFVTDRNNLRKLFGWVSGKDLSRWRIDFERVNNTILMLRFDLPISTEAVERDRIATCFENQCTTGDNQDSSYRAIIKAKFGPHRMLLRCEVDAFDPPSDSDDENSLVERMAALVTQDTPSLQQYPGSELKFELGKPAPPDLDVQHFVEIKSKKRQTWNKVKGDTFAYIWPQIFFAGIDRVVVGIRDQDTITSILDLSQNDILRHSDFQYAAAVEKHLAVLSDVMTWLASKMSEDGSRYSLMFEPLDNPSRLLRLYKRPTTENSVSAVPKWLRDYIRDTSQPKPRPEPES